MVTDRTELDIQLHGEFADAGAISPEAQVHADSVAHLRELLAADHRYVFTLIHKFRLARRGETADAGAVGSLRRHRDHRRGAPQPVRHARAQHAPGAAERLVHGLHRHPADRRARSSDPRSSSATTSASTTSATPSRTARPSRSTTRTASPSCSSSTRTSPTSSTRSSRRPSSTRTPRASSRARFGTQYTLLTRPERLKTIAKDLVAPLRRPRLHRQGDVRRARQGRRRADVRPRPGGVGRAPGRAAGRSTMRCRSWSGRGWPSRIELMETTDMAVVVSQSQNEIARCSTTSVSTSARTASG